MGIPKIFNHSQFFTIFDIKNWEFPFFRTIFRILIFLRSKFEPGISQIFNLKYICLWGVSLISGIAHLFKQSRWAAVVSSHSSLTLMPKMAAACMEPMGLLHFKIHTTPVQERSDMNKDFCVTNFKIYSNFSFLNNHFGWWLDYKWFCSLLFSLNLVPMVIVSFTWCKVVLCRRLPSVPGFTEKARHQTKE